MTSSLASSYLLMMENPAWKHLMGELEEIREISIKDEDRMPTSELNLAVFAECRGIRKGLDELLRRVDDIVNS